MVDLYYNKKRGRACMNFKDYITNNRILIPMLQREYVQGQSIKGERFIESIFLKLIQDHSMQMDLVFHVQNISNMNGDKENKSEYIEPIDGQQRLTTLYLMHYYIYSREGVDYSFLANFSYATRESSTDFCSSLVREIEIGDGVRNGLKPSEIIRNHPKYHVVYDYDYTVQSMIKMLDLIHERYQADNSDNRIAYHNRLNKIEFDVLDMGKYALGDEIYVIMNDRGKALTAYENLKSSLIEWMSYGPKKSFCEKMVRNFSHKLDTVWTERIWKLVNQDEEKTDLLMYRLICRYFYELCVENEKKIKENRYEYIQDFFYEEDADKYYSKNFEKMLDLVIDDQPSADYVWGNLETYLDCLTSIADNNTTEINMFGIANWNDNSNQEKLISNCLCNLSINDNERPLFYGLRLWINEPNKTHNIENWKRFVWNFCEGSDLSSKTTMIRVIKRLATYKGNIDDINTYLSTMNEDGDITKEEKYEIRKAKWIVKNPAMYDEIKTAEKHPFLHGAIDWLVKGINDSDTPADFKERYEVASMVFFDDRGIRLDEDRLVIRALLSKTEIDKSVKKNSKGTSIILVKENKADSHNTMLTQFQTIWDEPLRSYLNVTGKSNNEYLVVQTMRDDIKDIPNYSNWGDTQKWHEKLCEWKSEWKDENGKKYALLEWIIEKNKDDKRVIVEYPHSKADFRISLGTNPNDPKIIIDRNGQIKEIEEAIENNPNLETLETLKLNKISCDFETWYYLVSSAEKYVVKDKNGNKVYEFVIRATGAFEDEKGRKHMDASSIINDLKSI